MTYNEDRGYVIPAFNSGNIDYIKCAKTLAKSLRYQHPDVKICLVTSEKCNDKLFDYVVVTEDLGGYLNDYQAYAHSPFHETIKLEADALIASEFDHWWTFFRHYDVWISTGCRNYKNQMSASRQYRKIIDANHLPDVYNAITYWRVSPLAKKFFSTVKTLMNNWSSVQNSLLYAKDEPVNTDLAYAVAAEFIGREQFTSEQGPKIVHMKPAINNLGNDDWNKQLVWEIVSGQVRLNGFTQTGLLHYHVKNLAEMFGECYD